MNIHEFQGKSLLNQFDIPVQPGIVLDLKRGLSSLETLSENADENSVFAVKAQIHAGGRGAGRFKDKPDGEGGVRVLTSIDDVRAHAEEMVNSVLVTKQTGPEGKEVKRLYRQR